MPQPFPTTWPALRSQAGQSFNFAGGLTWHGQLQDFFPIKVPVNYNCPPRPDQPGPERLSYMGMEGKTEVNRTSRMAGNSVESPGIPWGS